MRIADIQGPLSFAPCGHANPSFEEMQARPLVFVPIPAIQLFDPGEFIIVAARLRGRVSDIGHVESVFAILDEGKS